MSMRISSLLFLPLAASVLVLPACSTPASSTSEKEITRQPRIAVEDRVPTVTHAVEPQLSDELASTLEEGTVVVEFVVEIDGSVRDAKAIESPDERLSAVVVAAISQWRFEPGVKNGELVSARLRQALTFKRRQAEPTDDNG